MSVSITKQSISLAFFSLLKLKPYEKITVSDVADMAGVNRMTFYYHFKDIDDLVFKTIEKVFLNICKKSFSSGNCATAYREIYLTVSRHKEMAKKVYPAFDMKRLVSFLSPMAFKLASYLIEAKAGKRIPTEKKEIFVHSIGCCMVGSFIEWLNSDMEKDPCELVAGQFELFEITINAMIPKKENPEPQISVRGPLVKK